MAHWAWLTLRCSRMSACSAFRASQPGHKGQMTGVTCFLRCFLWICQRKALFEEYSGRILLQISGCVKGLSAFLFLLFGYVAHEILVFVA